MPDNLPDYLDESIAGKLVTEHASVHICVSSIGLDELKPKQARDRKLVLKILAEKKRFSTFDAIANQDIANTITFLGQKKFFKTVGGHFPWINIEITDEGKAYLAE